MPKLRRTSGAIGIALSAYDVWKRLSPRQRKLVVHSAKRYGPLIAAAALRSAKDAAGRRRKA